MEDAARRSAKELLGFIDACPSPWHAVDTVRARLGQAGYTELRETESAWRLEPGQGYFVTREGSSIVAFRLGAEPRQGWRIIGAHTDSPGLRLKPRGAQERAGLGCLAFEVYGGPILATFADRELELAGRIWLRHGDRLESRLYRSDRPLLRLPTPAIHLNREVNEQGLRFDPQDELYGVFAGREAAAKGVGAALAAELGVAEDALAGWELGVADTQPGALFGLEHEFIASPRLDNLASCNAALEALLTAAEPAGVALCAFFDHEEVGSQSYVGAEGSFLPDTLGRIVSALELEADERPMRARGLALSADMAHAFHPNFPRFYDEAHAVAVNGGPVIKINAKQRYATDGYGQAYFAELCEGEGVPCQRYVHRNNLPCGSTIGPIVAARLGIRTVDVGNPMWSMHSARESAGAFDHERMIRVMRRFFVDDGLRSEY